MQAVDRIRLARLLGMLGSGTDENIAHAAREADRFVRAAGLSWAAILDIALDDGPGAVQAGKIEDAIAICVANLDLFDNRELRFLASIHGRPLTDRQLRALGRLAWRAHQEGMA
jgi:hypothetical protein